MKYKIIVDKQSRTNPSSEKREYEIDIEELRTKGNIYDSLIITKNEDYVLRRLSLSQYHVLNVLEEPIKEQLTDINIELFEGDNYIYLVDMVGNKFYAEYLVKNDFTDTYVTINQMNSAINQTAWQIELTVNQKLEGYSTTEEMNSAIKVTADGINSQVSKKVGEDEIISKINQSAEKILISGDKIDINGKAVNFSTEINQIFGPYTESDVERINKIIVQKIIPTNEDYDKYDIDGDGIISSLDSLRVLKAINKGNGYYKVTGTFTIDPYSTQKSVKIYNEDKPMSILSVLSNYFREIDIDNTINFLENDDISGWISTNGFFLSSNNEKANNLSSFFGISSVNSEIVGTFDITSSHGSIFADTCSNAGAEIILSKNSGSFQTIVKASGITTPQIQVNGEGYVMYGMNTHKYRCNWTGSQLQFWVDQTNVGTLSDKRLKTGIKDIDIDFINIIKEIEMKQFKVANRNGLISFGILAQDLIEIFKKYNKNPFEYEIVQETQYKTDDETVYYTINYEQYLILKSKAQEQEIKELQDKDKQKDELIQNLIQRIEKLEVQNGKD